MSGPLHGLKVLDLTQMMAGPLCSMILGDLGATVIKVEPESGDAMREVGTERFFGFTEYFISLNRNKRSLVLDLKSEAGQAAVQSLARDADIILENFRPGVAARLGLDYEALKEKNPNLIYCAMRGFSANSPYSNKPALDPVIQALSGLMHLNGTKSTGALVLNTPFADYNTPLIATIGILSAIHARQNGAPGQLVEVDMLTSTIFGTKPREQYTLLRGEYPQREGNEHAQLAPYNSYRTRDGREIVIIVHNQKYWHGLCQVLGIPELKNNETFGTNAMRLKNRQSLEELIGSRIAQDDLSYWSDAFSNNDVIFGAVNTLGEILGHPEIRDSMLVDTKFDGGSVPIMGIPIGFSETPYEVRSAPPELGEANSEIFGADGQPYWPEVK